MAGFFPPVTDEMYSTRSTRPVAMPCRGASNPCGAFGNTGGCAVCASRATVHTVQPMSVANGSREIRVCKLTISSLLN
jgi:hypothetical protein